MRYDITTLLNRTKKRVRVRALERDIRMLRALARGMQRQRPEQRLVQEALDSQRLFFLVRFRDLFNAEKNRTPDSKAMIAKEVLKTYDELDAEARKVVVHASVQRQLTEIGLGLRASNDESDCRDVHGTHWKGNEVKKSVSIETKNRDDEEGVFVSGDRDMGDVVSLYPGIVYAKDALRFMRGYPNVARENEYLVARFDDAVVDAKPWEDARRKSSTSGSGSSGAGSGVDSNWPGFPLVTGDCDGDEGKNREIVVGALKKDWVEKLPKWLEKLSRPILNERIKRACLNVSRDLIDLKNPYAFAHKANHPPKGELPNVMICMHDYDIEKGVEEAFRILSRGIGDYEEKDETKRDRMRKSLRAAIPNVYLSNDIRDYERFDSSKNRNSFKSKFAALFEDGNDSVKHMSENEIMNMVTKAAPTIVLVATREIKHGEELFLDYRLSSHVPRPDWYVPVDSDGEERRWS